MRNDDKKSGPPLDLRVDEQSTEPASDEHVVFDFTGLQQVHVEDLSLILTARLQSAPSHTVWVRSLPWRTAQVLKILKLDHLFQAYPEADEQMN